MSTTADDSRVGELAARVSGPVLAPGDDAYDTARAVHNGLIDRKPALIVRCRMTADVVAALEFARQEGLEVSVRGGGHNVGGRAVADGALMIDLAELKTITVDPDAGTATAGGGVTWGELNAATGEHGLAVTGGAISTTGIAGLTLGGGLGWLMAKYALAADNLVSVELVSATGEILNVDESSHPDLMWALRGGGGNFGVATSFTYRVHPLSMVTGGLVAHPFDAARDMFRFYRDAVSDIPDDLTVFAALTHAPDGSGAKLAAMVVFHTGDPDAAERDLEPFKSWGSPAVVDVGQMPYPVMNTILDDGFPAGSFNYWLSKFTRELSDDLIDVAVDAFAKTPSPMTSILFEHFHGAVTRVGVTDTAVPHRDEGWNVALASIWADPADTDANTAWTRETFAALEPHVGTGRWLNYLVEDQGDDGIRGAFGPNYDRLREVKRRYDPDNVFHLNVNVAP